MVGLWLPPLASWGTIWTHVRQPTTLKADEGPLMRPLLITNPRMNGPWPAIPGVRTVHSSKVWESVNNTLSKVPWLTGNLSWETVNGGFPGLMEPKFSPAPCQLYNQMYTYLVVTKEGYWKLHPSTWGLCDAADVLRVMYPSKSEWGKPAVSCEFDW